MWITLLLFFIFAGCIAALYTEGMWGNGVRLINVVTAGLLATNFFEPVADWLEGCSTNFATFTYLWDFLAFWGMFGLFMIIFRLATDEISKVKVRFMKIVDRIGAVVFSAWIGWVMVCLTATSLHLAPLAREFLFDSFHPEQRAQSNYAPELKWLGFMQKQSRGAFCRTPGEEDFRVEPAWKEDRTRTFDPRSEFMPKYATRRANLQAYNQEHKAVRVRPEHLPR